MKSFKKYSRIITLPSWFIHNWTAFVITAGVFFMQKEIWKDIPGYEGYYQINESGAVKSLNHYRDNKGYRILKAHKHYKTGYMQVHLFKSTVHSFWQLHRLMAITFIPNPDNKPHINHKDGNRTNNSIDNLEWVTSSENHIHAYKVLHRKKPIGANAMYVEAINEKGKVIKSFMSLRKAGLEHGDRLAIRQAILNNKIYKGTYWRIKTETT